MVDQTTYRLGIGNEFIDFPLSPMILTGGMLSDGTGVLDISSITALIRISDSDVATLKKISLDAQYGLTIPVCCTTYYVVLKYNDGNPSISIQTDYPNNTVEICIGKCLRDYSDVIHFCNCGLRFNNGVYKLHKKASQIESNKLVSGCAISYTGTNNFLMTAGVLYEGLNKYESSSFSSLIDKFTYVYNDGSWVYLDNQTTIDNNQYNNYGVGLATISNNRYGIHWVYMHPDDEHVYVVYGAGSYTAAEASIAQPPANLPVPITDFSALIGKIIIYKGASSFYNIEMSTDVIFSGTGATDHNGLANLQGGQASEYYHMTQSEHAKATQDASTTQKGLSQFNSNNFTVTTGVVSIKNINYGTVLAENNTYIGQIMTVQVDDALSVFGKVLYQGNDFHYDLALANDATTTPVVVMALESGAGAKKVLVKGQVCNTSWDWNAGRLYLSDITPGDMIQIQPSDSGDQIQVLGWALSADTIFFNPSMDVTEVI